MASWFPLLVAALSSDEQLQHPDEIEIAFEQCTVHAAPVEEGAALGVTVRLARQEDLGLFADADVLRAMIRLHQGSGGDGHWRFALGDDDAPIFVTTLDAELATPERFQSLVDDAIAHVQLVFQLARIIRAPSTAAIDMNLWMTQRG